jgi:RNA polymerase sigma-70 factor (ECF subfamily)
MNARFIRLQRAAPARAIDWDAVYRDHLPRVYNFFRYRIGDDATAEDLTAATFERAYAHREKYAHDLGAFSTWVFTIAQNLAVDHFRRRRPSVSLDSLPDLPADDDIEDTAARRYDSAKLTALLAGLEARERELIALKYGAELPHREIARLTGLSEGNVATTLHRLVRKLRAQWDMTP